MDKKKLEQRDYIWLVHQISDLVNEETQMIRWGEEMLDVAIAMDELRDALLELRKDGQLARKNYERWRRIRDELKEQEESKSPSLDRKRNACF